MTEFVLAVAVLTLMYAVAGGWWLVGFATAYMLAVVVDEVTA